MDPSSASIEVATVRWEQWIGAALRAEHGRALLAAARRPRRGRRCVRSSRRPRRSLLWMLAVSMAGYWLLR